MPAVKETTIHDMKKHFSQYSSALLAGEYDEIVVKNRTVPILRILPFKDLDGPGLRYGVARERGHAVVSDDCDMNDGDEEVVGMFEACL